MGVTITVKNNSREFLRNLERSKVRFVTKGGSIIQTEMRARAPKDTGNLINSIQTETGIEGSAVFSETGPTADYAQYVEYGTGVHSTVPRKSPGKDQWTYQSPDGNWYTTSGSRAQPFAEPGFQAAEPKIDVLARKELNE